jgi:Dolichyl-phosphate-mannose-protein mannosyltransferase
MPATTRHASRALASKSGLMSRTNLALLGAIFLVLVFFGQGIFFIRGNSQTVDEAAHLAAGYSYLATRDFRLNPEHPPLIKELLALPLFVGYRLPFNPDPRDWSKGDGYAVGRHFLYKSTLPADQMLALSRLANLALGGALLVLIGWWAYRLWGRRAAMLAMVLASLEPNLVAHSSLVTTDMGVALFIFLTIYLLWEYVNLPTWTLLASVGISTGMALVSKFSAVLLIPMIALIVAVSVLIRSEPYVLLPLGNNQNQPRHKFLHAVLVLFFILFFASLAIPLAYFFQGFSYWLHGFDKILMHAQHGHASFFLGKHYQEGQIGYFLVAFFIKTPIGTLALIFASLALYRSGKPLDTRQVIFLILPVILLFGAASQAKINIGIRHILPVYPFLFVLASRLATVHFRWGAVLIIAPLILTAISSLRIAPHQLAYFNEFIGGPEQGYRYLSDSNLDWGQDLKGVKAYMEKERLPIIYLSYFGTAPPSYYGIRYQYVPSTGTLELPLPADKVPATAARKILAISVYNLQDVATAYNPLFRWLWMRQPIAKIGYSIFIYDLTDDRDGLVKLEETYAKAGSL